MRYVNYLAYQPVQEFNRDLAEIGEISARLARPRRDWRDLAEINEISARFVLSQRSRLSRRDDRDLVEIALIPTRTRRDL